MSSIPDILLQHLFQIEPEAEFTGRLPRLESSSGAVYYAKLGAAKDAEQWAGEAASLKAMKEAAPGLSPHLHAFGIVNDDGEEISPNSEETGTPYFLSQYIDFHSLTDKAASLLGQRLAEMHAKTSDKGFGFDVPTYCGVTRFSNGWSDTWPKAFGKMIREMLSYLRNQDRSPTLQKKGEEVVQRVVPYLLETLDIQPALLHGDLWSGNTDTDRASGQPIIFDPASYYGHNEADLAIARIFGGIPKSFFTSYEQHMPRSEPQDQYELRATLYEMFHYLNHTVMFGGGYSGSTEAKMDKLLSACPSSPLAQSESPIS